MGGAGVRASVSRWAADPGARVKLFTDFAGPEDSVSVSSQPGLPADASLLAAEGRGSGEIDGVVVGELSFEASSAPGGVHCALVLLRKLICYVHGFQPQPFKFTAPPPRETEEIPVGGWCNSVCHRLPDCDQTRHTYTQTRIPPSLHHHIICQPSRPPRHTCFCLLERCQKVVCRLSRHRQPCARPGAEHRTCFCLFERCHRNFWCTHPVYD